MALLRARESAATIEDEAPEFWLSISDVMTGLVMLFLMILMVVLLQKGEQLDRQRRIAAEKEIELKRIEAKVRATLGVRAELVEALLLRFRETDSRVEIDPKTGALRLGDAVLFAFNSAELTSEGQKVVLTVYQRLAQVLFESGFDFQNHLADISIEGHASRESLQGANDARLRQAYLANLDLSQRRAQAVLAYLSGAPGVDRDLLSRFAVAVGYGFSRPRNVEDPASPENRRIEFTFRLRDEKALEGIKELLGGAAAETPAHGQSGAVDGG